MAKLLRDMDIENLYSMRREGMSNKEIAQSLGISYGYVLQLIGKQPKDLTSKAISEGRCASCAPTPAKEEPPPSPCLEVVERSINLNGLFGQYFVSVDKRTVLVSFREDDELVCFNLDMDKLEILIEELEAVKRNLSSIRVSKEMW